MKKFFRKLALITGALLIATFGPVIYLAQTLPETYYISTESVDHISCGSNVSGVPSAQEGVMALKLFGVIPIKNASVTQTDAPLLIPGGTPVGIKLLTDGVMVVELRELDNGICPCEEAGLQPGDCIKKINGEEITSSGKLSQMIEGSDGKTLSLTVERGGKIKNLSLTPAYSKSESCYKAGLVIRDSSAGVGTLTFVEPDTGAYGALGHPVSDFDTGTLMPLHSGEIVSASITSFDRSRTGAPGELHGMFISDNAIGSITANCDRGIYGVMTKLPDRAPIPMAFKSEVMAGKATMITTINGSTPKEYDIEIEKITLSNTAGTKNMVIHVTDKELLAATGGIVQGMSGSPIIQNGKLVGAVTHVFISDPTRGYGIFAENMVEML